MNPENGGERKAPIRKQSAAARGGDSFNYALMKQGTEFSRLLLLLHTKAVTISHFCFTVIKHFTITTSV